MKYDFPANTYVGRHVIVEFWGSEGLDNAKNVEYSLVSAAEAAEAHVLGSNSHHFGEGMGVTSVVMLAESHISIHTWPELEYAAIDIFMCGKSKIDQATKVLKNAFRPKTIRYLEILRGHEHDKNANWKTIAT